MAWGAMASCCKQPDAAKPRLGDNEVDDEGTAVPAIATKLQGACEDSSLPAGFSCTCLHQSGQGEKPYSTAP